MKNFPDLPPIWTLAAFFGSWIFAKILPIGTVPSYGVQLLGLVWIAIAILIVLWSAIYFKTNKTTIEPHNTPAALITKGPYRFTRNPIYLAMVIASAGFAMWCGAATALIPTVVLAIVLHRRFVMPEEKVLRETFGKAADDYIAKSKRWA
jgi:protein-S-isoprenylcysteine O-methyltransferase Ste14